MMASVAGKKSQIESRIVLVGEENIKLENPATVWDDLRVPISSTKLGGSNDPTYEKFLDDGGTSQGVFLYSFADPGPEQEVYFDAQLPHSYKEGTDLHAHLHWAPSTADAGDVTWGLEYTWANIGDEFPATTLVSGSHAANGTANEHQLASVVTMDGTGKRISSMLVCRLFRSAGGDTYGEKAWLLEFDFHYEIDTMGSRQLFTK